MKMKGAVLYCHTERSAPAWQQHWSPWLRGEGGSEGSPDSKGPHLSFKAPQMIKPIITPTITKTTIRMQIFFLDLR